MKNVRTAILCASINAITSPTFAEESIISPVIQETKVQVNNTLSETKKDTTVIDTKTLKKSPLDKKGISPSLASLLGENQVEQIITTHNPKIREKYPTEQRILYSEIDSLEIPLIFDELKTIFPENLALFLDANPEFGKFKEKLGANNIFVVKIKETQKYALAYYEEGVLKLATHTSPWKKSGTSKWKDGAMLAGGIKTPEWVFTIGYKETNKVSRAFENAPMPYALNVHEGIFIHTGRVDWTPLSHWCIRIPWLYAQQLFGKVPLGTKVIISFSWVDVIKNNPSQDKKEDWILTKEDINSLYIPTLSSLSKLSKPE